MLSCDEVEEQAVQCNRKKKAAKIVGVGKICAVHITVHHSIPCLWRLPPRKGRPPDRGHSFEPLSHSIGTV